MQAWLSQNPGAVPTEVDQDVMETLALRHEDPVGVLTEALKAYKPGFRRGISAEERQLAKRAAGEKVADALFPRDGGRVQARVTPGPVIRRIRETAKGAPEGKDISAERDSRAKRDSRRPREPHGPEFLTDPEEEGRSL